MILLAADTSTSYYSVAVCNDAHVVAEVNVDANRRHAEELIEAADWALRRAGVELEQVDVLAISRGPGSFTGLRVGVSAWKGLAAGADLPLVGVSTLDAMSRLVSRSDGVICPLLDARMREIYGAVYRFEGGIRSKTGEDRVCAVEAFVEGLSEPVVFYGEGAMAYRDRIEAAMPEAEILSDAFSYPRASAVAQEALAALAAGASSRPEDVRPDYLRKSQAETEREARRQETTA